MDSGKKDTKHTDSDRRILTFSSSYQNKNGELGNLLPRLCCQWQRGLRFTAERQPTITNVIHGPRLRWVVGQIYGWTSVGKKYGWRYESAVGHCLPLTRN